MIEADIWCPDVVTRIASITRAMQEVAVDLLNDHPVHCVVGAARTSRAEGEGPGPGPAQPHAPDDEQHRGTVADFDCETWRVRRHTRMVPSSGLLPARSAGA
jgi:hypothetical protein